MKTTTLALFSLLAVLTTPFGATVAEAATMITESFSAAGENSVTPDGWTPTSLTAVDIVDGRQRIRRVGTGDGTGPAAIYYTGSQGTVQNGMIQDFEAELTIQFNNTGTAAGSLRGVVFRAQTAELHAPSSETFWGYSVGLIISGNDAGFYLFENPTGTNFASQGTRLDFASFSTTVDNNTDYILQLSAIGSNLTASLLTHDKQTLIASVSYDEAEQKAGYFGLRAAYPNTSIETFYSNLTLTAIPEPGTVAFLGFGVLAVFIRQRARRASLKVRE